MQETQEEQQLNLQKNPVYDGISHFQIFNQISQYLGIKDVLKLMLVNKNIRNNVQRYLQSLLRKFGHLTEEQSEQKDQDISFQNENYHLVYKYFYNREVLYTTLLNPIQNNNADTLKVFRSRNSKQTCGLNLKTFQIGPKFTAFLTDQNDLYYCKTTEYIESVDVKFVIRKNIKQFSTKPKNLFYLTQAGTVCVVFFDEETQTSDLQESLIPFTASTPVESFQASYILCMFVLKEQNEEEVKKNTNFLETIILDGNDEENVNISDTKKNIVFYYIQDISTESVACKYRYKRITNYPYSDDILDYVVGCNAYIITHKHEVLEVDLSDFVGQTGLNKGWKTCSNFKNFENKQITRLWTGLYSYFALEREEIPAIADWDSKRLQSFMDSIGFQDYTQIIRYQNIQGKDFTNIDKSYMVNTLGLTQEDLQIKLQSEILKYKNITHKQIKLYGWGKNENGQLGIIPSIMVNNVQQIQLPEFAPDEIIDDIQIGWKNSTLLTSQNNIFITDQTPKIKQQFVKKNQKISKQREDSNSQYNNTKQKAVQPKKKKGKKQNKEEQQEQQTQDEIDSEEEKLKLAIQQQKYRWIDFTSKFTELNDKRKYKIYGITNSNNYIGILGSCYEEKLLQQLKNTQLKDKLYFSDIRTQQIKENKQFIKKELKKQEYNDQDEVQKKFKLTKTGEIINRIKWDDKFNKDEITVVYEDRFLGDLEVPYNDFIQNEAKNHRVKIFKIKGEIFWDKENRVDLFQQM